MKEIKLHDKVFKPFVNASKIDAEVQKLAQVIQKDYHGKTPVFIGVLNGSFMFFSDLMKAYEGTCEVSFVKVSSYSGTQTLGNISEQIGLYVDIQNKDVIIVEDIVDTGHTIEKLYLEFSSKKPASLKVATCLYKPNAYKKHIKVDYVAMEVGNEFLVGYGLDYDGLGRNLKDIYIICD